MTDQGAIIANIKPFRRTEVAHLYWKTTIPAAEIVSACRLDCHVNRISERAGPALLRLKCEQCSGPFKVRSRAEAQQAFDTRKRLEKARERERNGRNHSHLCIQCKEREFAWMSQEPKRRNRYPKLAAAGGRYA